MRMFEDVPTEVNRRYTRYKGTWVGRYHRLRAQDYCAFDSLQALLSGARSGAPPPDKTLTMHPLVRNARSRQPIFERRIHTYGICAPIDHQIIKQNHTI